MKKRAILLILNLMVGMLVWGQARVPARKGVFAVVQPNGDSLHIELIGDEHRHYRRTADGFRLTQDNKGWWRYEKANHKTGLKAKDADQRGCYQRWWVRHYAQQTKTAPQMPCPRRVVRNDSRAAELMAADRIHRAALAEQAVQSTPRIGTLTLTPKAPVIMVNFSDISFSYSHSDAETVFNDVSEYMRRQSLGQYVPEFDVIGPVNLSRSYSYYGQGGGGYEPNAQEMIREACELVNDSVDFSQYDSDNDGYIDLVFVYYAGFGQNDEAYIDSRWGINTTSLVWPHYSTISGNTQFDGKTLRAYECANELDGYISTYPDHKAMAGTGVLVHEFAHGMGLPDVYVGSTQYMGSWTLMDYGCYNDDGYHPAPFTGYERWFCGWSQPRVLDRLAGDTLRPIATSGDFLVIGGAPATCHTGAYTILENHQPVGDDIYAAGSGLIEYHIQYHSNWSRGANNGTQGYVLLPADGILREGGYVGKPGDCYPTCKLDSLIGYIPTGVENVNNDENRSRKVLRDGKIRITRGNQTYSIMGQIVH